MATAEFERTFLKQPVAKIRGVLKPCVSQIVWRTHTSNQPMMREEKPVA